MMIVRIAGVSAIAGGLGVVLGLALFARYGDCTWACLFLACVGAVIGAIAGAGREIATALQQRPCPDESARRVSP
jgi:uncharacterized membrane protein YfcA